MAADEIYHVHRAGGVDTRNGIPFDQGRPGPDGARAPSQRIGRGDHRHHPGVARRPRRRPPRRPQLLARRSERPVETGGLNNENEAQEHAETDLRPRRRQDIVWPQLAQQVETERGLGIHAALGQFCEATVRINLCRDSN